MLYYFFSNMHTKVQILIKSYPNGPRTLVLQTFITMSQCNKPCIVSNSIKTDYYPLRTIWPLECALILGRFLFSFRLFVTKQETKGFRLQTTNNMLERDRKKSRCPMSLIPGQKELSLNLVIMPVIDGQA